VDMFLHILAAYAGLLIGEGIAVKRLLSRTHTSGENRQVLSQSTEREVASPVPCV